MLSLCFACFLIGMSFLVYTLPYPEITHLHLCAAIPILVFPSPAFDLPCMPLGFPVFVSQRLCPVSASPYLAFNHSFLHSPLHLHLLYPPFFPVLPLPSLSFACVGLSWLYLVIPCHGFNFVLSSLCMLLHFNALPWPVLSCLYPALSFSFISFILPFLCPALSSPWISLAHAFLCASFS